MPISREYLDNEPKHNGDIDNAPNRAKTDSGRTKTKPIDGHDTSFGEQIGPGQSNTSESRQELIARIKRDQRPIWMQEKAEPPRATDGSPSQAPKLLPPADVGDKRNVDDTKPTALELASTIERPRSALHAGDFREEHSRGQSQHGTFDVRDQGHGAWTSTSPTDPWYSPSFSALRNTSTFDPFRSPPPSSRPFPAQTRNRAASQSSLSSSFVLRPPTSPLAHTSEIYDFDDRETERTRSRSPTKSSRRHTFSPRSLRATQYSPTEPTSDSPFGIPVPFLRREESEPHFSREKRRSISILSNIQHHSTPLTPISRSRRASILSDGSPLQAPMVGGYEESILRGRMSTLPSRPLDFVAQIGVLGKGDCKRSLRCPPHISIPFPAVYYNYGNTREGPSASDGPSPYVGLIDMEGFSKEREDDLVSNTTRGSSANGNEVDMNTDEGSLQAPSRDLTPDISPRKQRPKLQFSTASRKGPKGAYRIPQQGQLQIIIKNPNKTAVKLFLIPYDLAGMEAGQKTFIRQRSYSAGPIIDMPLSCRTNLGSDRPEASLSNSNDPNDRPVLRYLIHLHICCPYRGRFYLYRSIRVVFANRVPDGKEKLRNEIQLPEPRYSTFKPDADQPRPQRSTDSRTSTKSSTGMDQGPPSVPTEADFAFGTRTGENASSIAQSLVSNQKMLFRRKQLPTTLPEISSLGSGSSHRSDPMQVDSPKKRLSPRSVGLGQPMNLSFVDPEASDNPLDRVGGVAGRSSEARSREQSPSPRSGLLSLQLRDLAQNGTKHTEA